MNATHELDGLDLVNPPANALGELGGWDRASCMHFSCFSFVCLVGWWFHCYHDSSNPLRACGLGRGCTSESMLGGATTALGLDCSSYVWSIKLNFCNVVLGKLNSFRLQDIGPNECIEGWYKSYNGATGKPFWFHQRGRVTTATKPTAFVPAVGTDCQRFLLHCM